MSQYVHLSATHWRLKLDKVKTAGFAFVEFVSSAPSELAALFGRLGFSAHGQSTDGALLMTQGAAAFVVNGRPNSFQRKHGPSVRAIGILVDDAAKAVEQALEGGATLADPSREGDFVINAPAILGIGDSLVYFIDFDPRATFNTAPLWGGGTKPAIASIVAIDHTSNIVHPSNLDKWSDFYKDSFGFTEKQYLEVKGRVSGMRARSMVSPNGLVSIPIAAAAHDSEGVLNQNDEFIRDYSGEGIQHIALLTTDIEATIASLSCNGIEFMEPPSSHYYDALASRLPGHGLDVQKLAQQGILVDGKDAKRVLLQRFTCRQIGPVFFELIERRGEDGFGQGNFKALFESQERDQQQRGSLLNT